MQTILHKLLSILRIALLTIGNMNVQGIGAQSAHVVAVLLAMPLQREPCWPSCLKKATAAHVSASASSYWSVSV